jgi:hypothetical protein
MNPRILPILLLSALPAASFAEAPFGIRVFDEATGRGVPMVQLKTTHHLSYYTDSAGWVAFDEPGLLGSRVHFTVEADGYEHRADGFGIRGVALQTEPGGRGEIRVTRLHPAERLYRLTGGGIYRDSVLLGEPVPIEQPLLNGRVMGQDSAVVAQYKDRLHWFWGDTSWPEYPLGNFAAAGATALLPANGGLPPSVGVNYTYYTGEKDFTRGMVEMEGEGVKWLGGLFVIKDPEGNERMVARCSRMKSLGEELERVLVVWDDEREVFTPFASLPLESKLAPGGQVFTHPVAGVPYLWFTSPYPMLRVPATWEAIQDPESYEGFTCLAEGSPFDPEAPALDRDTDGRLVWGWKKGTPPLNIVEQRDLVARGHIEDAERWHRTTDSTTGEEITLWGGSVRWNPHLETWLFMGHQLGGTPSFLGEVWMTTSATPEGPWERALKIATHRVHDFYNVVHHDFFDEEGGRVVYFEGTLSGIFAPTAPEIPRYQYNQILYRLDLGDQRVVDFLAGEGD